jgi:hypothetical protein
MEARGFDNLGAQAFSQRLVRTMDSRWRVTDANGRLN